MEQALVYGAESLWLLFLSLLLYLLPGGAAVAWLLPEEDWIERLIVAMGLSVTINTMIVYATMTGLRIGSAFIWTMLMISGLLILARVVLIWLRSPIRLGARLSSIRRRLFARHQAPTCLALGVVTLLTLGTRIWIMHDMLAPRWGDSYQHTVIVQLLLDHGGIFESWEPYAPYNGLTMHFGFHANAALFHWISRIGAVRSVLWTGQIMNAMGVLVLYALARRIGSRWGGILAVAVSGLLTTTPMFYVNWGRYPQLTGQVLLPVAAWLLWQILDSSKLDWRLLFLAALTIAGQFLAYYRMPYYYAVLMGAVMLCVHLPRLPWRQWGKLLAPVVLVGAIAGLILVPWGLHLVRGHLATSFVEGIPGLRTIDCVRSEYAQWQYIHLYVSTPLLAMAGAAFLWALVRRAAPVIAVGLWGGGLFALVATRLVGLPGATHLNAFASMIFMYAPVSLLIGWLGAQIAAAASKRWKTWGSWGCAAVVVLLSLFGASKSLARSDPGYDLAKPADWEAMAWIRANTPRDARFLVNGFLIYEGTSIVGSDAGWWIPLLTERANTIPPQYALINERETEPGYGLRMVNLVARLRKAPLSTTDGLRLLCDEHITHVYIGQGEGRVGAPSPEPLFTAEQMLSKPAFEMRYHQDKVWVFALSKGACPPR